jgi:hypothetical protein
MSEIDTTVQELPANGEALPVTTFRNSLRQWQARWQAQQAAALAEPGVPRTFKVRPPRAGKAIRHR